MNNILALIPARGGSKGVPRKNIRPLAGKPLIAYAIEVARASQFINRVIVSTDDAEIAAVAQQYGAEVPFLRPAELARDDSPEWLVWQHTLHFVEAERGLPEALVCVSPTSPLRTVEDIDACIRTLLESKVDIVFAVKPADRNPYFNMVVLDEAGFARLVIPPIGQAIHRRQAAPKVYDMTTVAYAARPNFVLRANAIFEGKAKAVIVPAEHALDIDTEFDFRLAESMLSPVSDVMATFVSASNTLRQVLTAMNAARRGIALLVDDEHRLLSVLTEGDMRRAILTTWSLDATAGELAAHVHKNKPPLVAPVTASRAQMLELFRASHISHIPLVNEAQQVVGLIGLDDLLNGAD